MSTVEDERLLEIDTPEPLYTRESVNRSAYLNPPRKVQIVVVTSKYCNLRCRYCYEFPDLADRTAMSLEQLRQMYRSINDHYVLMPEPIIIELVWFGGEPLLLGADFYWKTFDDQTKIFDDPKVTVRNVVQTNLTVLTEPLTKLLSEGFDGVGVSIDLFSGLRVNASGRDFQPKVLKNMDRLRELSIPFGCITVLSRQNIGSLKKMFKFFSQSSISLRILPVHRGADEAQNSRDSLTEEEVLQAYKELFDMWVEATAPMIIEPMYSLSASVIAAMSCKTRPYYDKSAMEVLYVVNTDGNLYSYSDQFDLSLSHGNIFESSMREIVNGPGHQRAIEAAESRIAAICTDCRHFGKACSGYPAAEESPGRQDGGSGRDGAACTRERGLLDYIEHRLLELGVVDAKGSVDTKSKYFHHFDPSLRIRV